MKILWNGNVLSKNGFIEDGYVVYNDNSIIDVGQCINFHEDLTCFEVTDVHGDYIFPGFIDIHVNGGGRSMFIDGDQKAFQNIVLAHAQHGITSVIATTITVDPYKLKTMLNNIYDFANSSYLGANILGVHLEGPFININKAGAHNKKYILPPNIASLDNLFCESNNFIKIVSFAPELDENHDFLKKILSHNAIAGLAHSTADFYQANKAISNGLILGTHLFNAMMQIDSRNPGPIVAFLNNPNTYTEIIGDGQHVSYPLIEMVSSLKKDKLILVTDAIKPAGTMDTTCELDGLNINIFEDSCYLLDGKLAGSALTLDHAVQKIYKNTNLPLETIVHMVTSNPAKLLGIEDKKGVLIEGADSDIVVMSKDLVVKKVIINGITVSE